MSISLCLYWHSYSHPSLLLHCSPIHPSVRTLHPSLPPSPSLLPYLQRPEIPADIPDFWSQLMRKAWQDNLKVHLTILCVEYFWLKFALLHKCGQIST